MSEALFCVCPSCGHKHFRKGQRKAREEEAQVRKDLGLPVVVEPQVVGASV